MLEKIAQYAGLSSSQSKLLALGLEYVVLPMIGPEQKLMQGKSGQGGLHVVDLSTVDISTIAESVNLCPWNKTGCVQ